MIVDFGKFFDGVLPRKQMASGHPEFNKNGYILRHGRLHFNAGNDRIYGISADTIRAAETLLFWYGHTKADVYANPLFGLTDDAMKDVLNNYNAIVKKLLIKG